MAKRAALVCFFGVALLLGVFTFGKGALSKRVAETRPLAKQPLAVDPNVPDHVMYGVMFAKVVRSREKTRELQAKHRVGLNEYSPLQTEISLTHGQPTAREAIATVCQQPRKCPLFVAVAPASPRAHRDANQVTREAYLPITFLPVVPHPLSPLHVGSRSLLTGGYGAHVVDQRRFSL